MLVLVLSISGAFSFSLAGGVLFGELLPCVLLHSLGVFSCAVGGVVCMAVSSCLHSVVYFQIVVFMLFSS